jgi:hypothetical protein
MALPLSVRGDPVEVAVVEHPRVGGVLAMVVVCVLWWGWAPTCPGSPCAGVCPVCLCLCGVPLGLCRLLWAWLCDGVGGHAVWCLVLLSGCYVSGHVLQWVFAAGGGAMAWLPVPMVHCAILSHKAAMAGSSSHIDALVRPTWPTVACPAWGDAMTVFQSWVRGCCACMLGTGRAACRACSAR